jgi:hypothetical protein
MDPKSRMNYSLGQIESGILRLKWLAAATRFEIAMRNHDRALKAGYRSDQPRVPAGNSDGGQWINGGGGASRNPPRVTVDAKPNQSSQPRRQFAQLASGATNDSDPSALQRTSDNITADARPVYDKVDAALLAPKGINAEASSRRLRYQFNDDNLYLGGVTVTNEDRTVAGRMINALNNSPVHIGFEASIQTANGISTSSFEIRQNLPPGASITIPWKDFGLMQGPGSVTILATNKGSFYTGVVVGAMKAPSAPESR